MGEVVMTRSQTVLHLVSARTAAYCQKEDDDGRKHAFHLDPIVFEDMGRPEVITVTIEPGDLLNT